MEVIKDHVIFSNFFMMKEKTGVSQLVSFIPDVEVGFRCTYDKKRIALVSAPLQLDKLHSSPKEVTTYYGLPVELRCAFKYGAPPVRVVIVRKEKIIANQENGTQKVKITVEGLNKDYGSYTCVAEDVNNNKITHQMEIKKSTHRTYQLKAKRPLAHVMKCS